MLNNRTPTQSEMSHGVGRFPHPDSDFQSTTECGRNLPFPPSERNGGARRGGVTDLMLMEALKRSDPTNSEEFSGDYGMGGAEGLLFAKGNPDIFGPGPELVQATAMLPGPPKVRPTFPNGVYRQG